MNATVTIGGVDCSNRLVFLNRHHGICQMVASAEVGLDPTWAQAFSPYDEVIIHESDDGGLTKTFTGYMANVGHSRMPPARVINCQCSLKKVIDYWYTSFETGGSTVSALINSLMTTVGVSYSINDSYGYPTAEEEWMNTSAMDVFQSLLTMAGWQAYSDPDGVIQIGRLMKGTAVYTFNEGDNLISVESARDDSWIRNAMAVYGAPGISVKRYADDYEVGDFERAGAFANPLVATEATAIDIANKALDLFDSELHVVHAEVLGDPDVQIGQTASVTDTFTGLSAHTDMITTVRASMSADGYILDVMLGERCPTIWGFGAPPQYLYAATGGAGVYRSPDYGNNFVAVNGSGGSTLTGNALYVNAIEVDSGDNETVWAATNGGIYRTQNAGQTSWVQMDPGRLYRLNTFDYSTDPIYYDVDQDELHPELVFFVAVDHTMQNSWIVKCTGGSAWSYWQVRWYE